MFKAIRKARRAVSHGERRYLSYCTPLALLDKSNVEVSLTSQMLPLPNMELLFFLGFHCSRTLIHGCYVLAVFALRGLGGTCHSAPFGGRYCWGLWRLWSLSKTWVIQKQSPAAENNLKGNKWASTYVGFSGSHLFAVLDSSGKLFWAATVSSGISNNVLVNV